MKWQITADLVTFILFLLHWVYNQVILFIHYYCWEVRVHWLKTCEITDWVRVRINKRKNSPTASEEDSHATVRYILLITWFFFLLWYNLWPSLSAKLTVRVVDTLNDSSRVTHFPPFSPSFPHLIINQSKTCTYYSLSNQIDLPTGTLWRFAEVLRTRLTRLT